MKTKCICIAAIWLLTLPQLAAQTAPVIAMDQEPHHHLVMKNDVVKVFEIDLAPRDAIWMHRHDYDEVSVVIGDATIVSTSPGHADTLWMSKPGIVSFARGGMEHSVRNIGQTTYHSVSINLLRTQTGARNLCGTEIPDHAANCPPVAPDSNAPRFDQPQFETDQVRVTLSRISSRQEAAFGEPDRDNLIVAIDEATIAPSSGKTSGKTLAAGAAVWIARGGVGQILKNNSDKEVRVVTVAFKP